MIKNVTLLHDDVLVRELEEQERAKGGIFLSDTVKGKFQEGQVIAVGAGKLNEEGGRSPLHVKVGDHILFRKCAGNDIKIDDQEYLILREEEITESGIAKAASSKVLVSTTEDWEDTTLRVHQPDSAPDNP